MINIIYGLRDPRNDLYCYIGKSSVGNKRALSHLTKSHSSKVNEWIKELNNNWLYPLIDIIEEVDSLDDLMEREKYWIRYYYNLNPNLLNICLIPKNINNIRTKEDDEKFDYLCRIIIDIPNILKKERLARKMTQDKVAKLIGINRSTIVTIENNGCSHLRSIIQYITALKKNDIKTNILTEKSISKQKRLK
jgi:DNA-binding XRE family transcriptional regulator